MECWGGVSLQASGRPALVDGEVEVSMTNNVALKDSANKTAKENGSLTITNLRAVWISDNKGPSCAIALQQIKKMEKGGGIIAGVASPKIVLHLCPLLQAGNDNASTSVCYLSFRSGHRDEAYEHLQAQWHAKEWEKRAAKAVRAVISNAAPKSFTTQRAGLAGVRRQVERSNAESEESLKEAFTDLDALMKKAEDMVKLSERLAHKLKANEGQGGDQDKDKDDFGAMMLDLGITSPVTKEIAGSRYHSELAKQLADFLRHALHFHHGTMLMTDVFCLFNRARGVELVSPDDLNTAASRLQAMGVGMRKRVFPSGVVVIQSDEHDDDKASKRLLTLCEELGCLNETDCVRKLNIPLVLAKEQLKTAEALGYLCRDEAAEGLQFFPNRFLDW